MSFFTKTIAVIQYLLSLIGIGEGPLGGDMPDWYWSNIDQCDALADWCERQRGRFTCKKH